MAVNARHGLWLASLIVVALLAWSTWRLVLTVRQGGSGENAASVVQPAGPARPAGLRSAAAYEQIARYSVFGAVEPSAPAEPDGRSPARVSDTLEGIRLRGTIVDRSTGRARAILEEIRSSRQELFQAGDPVGEFELIKIDRETVTLERDGRQYVLATYQDEGPPEPSGAGSDQKAGERPERRPLVRKLPQPAGDRGDIPDEPADQAFEELADEPGQPEEPVAEEEPLPEDIPPDQPPETGLEQDEESEKTAE